MALPREEFFTIINFIDLCLEEQSNGFPKNFSCNFVLRTYAISHILIINPQIRVIRVTAF